MMNVLLTSLLATVVPADHHADVWAQMIARAPAPFEGRLEAAPMDDAPLQLAQMAPMDDGHPHGMPMHHRGDGPPHMMMGPGAGFGEHRHGPPFLRGLSLTEAQQDKIFEVRHAQAPQVRQRMRELHKAREELRTLARAERFDEARATAVADAMARAEAAIALLHARSEAAIWQVLTPEQRKQASEARPHDGPPMKGRGMMPPPR